MMPEGYLEVAKIISEKQKLIIKAISPLTAAREAIYESIDKINLSKKIQIYTLHRFLQNYNNSVALIIDVFNQVEWKNWENFLEEFGWLESISITYATELKKISKEKGKKEVWKELTSILSSNKLKHYFNANYFIIPIIKKRKTILEKAIEHHLAKDYVSSIPLFLSQGEGLIWDMGIEKKLVENKKNSKFKIDINGNLVLNSNGKTIEWKLGELMLHIFGQKSKLKHYAKNKIYSAELRHPILHGRETNYYDPEMSTRLLLFVMMVAEKIKINSQIKTQNKN